jgi:hypothetical protein
MPTVCELKIEAKNKGLKGYSKMTKTQLENLVAGDGGGAKKEEKKEMTKKDLSKFKPGDIPKFKGDEKPKKYKMNILKPKKKPEMPKKLAEEWGDLEKFGAGDIYEIIFENELEALARQREPKTETQQMKLFDRASGVAFRLMTRFFKKAKKGAKTNEEILKNLKEIYDKEY